jgi:hypothetical protein
MYRDLALSVHFKITMSRPLTILQFVVNGTAHESMIGNITENQPVYERSFSQDGI